MTRSPPRTAPPASVVLGQDDFTHTAPNDDDQDPRHHRSRADGPHAELPNGVAVVDGLLAVTDWGNGRVVIHRPPAP